MSEILSQAEIEALLNSLGSNDDDAPAAAPGPSQPASMSGGAPSGVQATFKPKVGARTTVAYEIYDFRRPDKFSKDQLRTLQMLHETFARLAGSNLSALLRAPISIDLISLEQVPYEEYLRSISSSVFTIISLPPLTGQAVLEMEFNAVFGIIDRLLGGPGTPFSRNVLTDIERPLIRNVLERMFASLKVAWEGVVIVNPSIDGMETSSQFVQIAPPNDIVVTILFEIKIGNQRSAMSLCIPYLVLKPITGKLSAQKWFTSGTRKQSPQNRRILSHQVGHTKVPCAIELGAARITMKDFLELETGDTIRLHQKTNHDLVMKVNKIPKFRGQPALQGKKIVFSVTEAIQE